MLRRDGQHLLNFSSAMRHRVQCSAADTVADSWGSQPCLQQAANQGAAVYRIHYWLLADLCAGFLAQQDAAKLAVTAVVDMAAKGAMMARCMAVERCRTSCAFCASQNSHGQCRGDNVPEERELAPGSRRHVCTNTSYT